ncbi:MAG: hypothetical protein PHH13_03370 [Candidatus Peribacteraceae bacterium]|nr:hypothetical protein [Candidatus Peribacteraceae bacterium]
MDQPLDQQAIQKKVEAFLKELNVPAFIVFGWKKGDSVKLATTNGQQPSAQAEFGLVSSFYQVPTNAAVKGLSWALNDFINRAL